VVVSGGGGFDFAFFATTAAPAAPAAAALAAFAGLVLVLVAGIGGVLLVLVFEGFVVLELVLGPGAVVEVVVEVDEGLGRVRRGEVLVGLGAVDGVLALGQAVVDLDDDVEAAAGE